MCNQYLWGNKKVHGNPEIKSLEQPLEKGGLQVQGIGNKALAMRAKQLRHIFDINSKAPASKTGRYWLSTSTTITTLFHYTEFIKNYDCGLAPRTANTGPSNKTNTEPKHKGYLSLALLCQQRQIKMLYREEGIEISSKLTYQILQKTKRIPNNTHITYWDKCTTNLTLQTGTQMRYCPDFSLSWRDLSSYKAQEILWKIRLFRLIQGDISYEKDSTYQWQVKHSCLYCKDNFSRDVRESHLHVFSLCPRIDNVWRSLIKLVEKIDPEPPERNLWFLGSGEKSPKGILFNTLASITDHQIWIARCEYEARDIRKSTNTIQIQIKQILKLRIIQFFEIYRKKGRIKKFEKRFKISKLFEIRDDRLVFFF
jgi:hypothetical protein